MSRYVIGVLAALLVVQPVMASADTIQSDIEKQPDSVTVEVQRQSHVGPIVGSRRRAGVRHCFYSQGQLLYELATDQGIEIPQLTTGQQGRWFTVACKTPDAAEYSYELRYIPLRSPVVTQPIDLAEEARRQLVLPDPEIHTSPPTGADSVVGVPVLLWVPSEAWQAEEATAEIPGVSVTVRAVPTRTVWSMGDGGQVECGGPGEPWDPALSEEAQPSSCRYTYRSTSVGQPDERFPVTATVYWKVTWTVEGGPGGGDLGEMARSGTTSIRVAQIQTVNVH
jgi:hypothetical protein